MRQGAACQPLMKYDWKLDCLTRKWVLLVQNFGDNFSPGLVPLWHIGCILISDHVCTRYCMYIPAQLFQGDHVFKRNSHPLKFIHFQLCDGGWPCKLFAARSQVKFHSRSQPCDLMRVWLEREMRLLSAGPCCEIKGHSHWMSKPDTSYLFPRWPTGKSNAIRPEKRPLSLRSLSSKSSPRPRSII